MGPQVTSAFLIPEALSSRHIDLDFDLDFDFDLIIEILVSCPKYIYVFGQCNNNVTNRLSLTIKGCVRLSVSELSHIISSFLI